ncbi:LysR family transcriptional regulator [Paraburkholderia sediminicola]|uniref:LysR family transcriptional regulator n=1 Tax=Paraburkholderia TaxID=1822464 RepID=UPI0038BDCD5C
MDIDTLDLNLLRIFDALIRTRNVTSAGEAVGLSQPAVSYALAKLRTITGDELFVRSRGGMEPTPRAIHMGVPIRQVLDMIRREVFQTDHFIPSEAERVFTLSLSDIGEMVFLPRLLRRLQTEAPHVTVKSVSLSPADLQEAMASGDVDLAAGYFPDIIKANFYQQHLFAHTFACLVREGHPTIRKRMTMKQFMDATHIVIRAEGRSQEIFERHLEEKRITRRVGLVIPHFMSVPHLLQATDMVATVPRSLAEALVSFGTVCMFDLPFETPKFDLKQYWHARFHRDPANQWLRQLVYESFIQGI